MDDNKKKIAFIINPISGTQGKEHILKWLDEKLDKNRYMPEVIYTEWAGHAVEIAARKAKEEVFAVVVIGTHQNGIRYYSMWLRKRTRPSSANSNGSQKGN